MLLLLLMYITQGNVEQNELTAKMEGKKKRNNTELKKNISDYYSTTLRLLSNHNDFHFPIISKRENVATSIKRFHKFPFLMWFSRWTCEVVSEGNILRKLKLTDIR